MTKSPRTPRTARAKATTPEKATKSPTTHSPATEAAGPARPKGKLATLVDLLRRPEGATIQMMAQATGWQAHSVRGALAGTLRRKGHQIVSEKVEGLRTWRIATEVMA